MPPLLKRVIFVVGILTLITFLVVIILPKSTSASIYSLPDALTGWGTNATQDITRYATYADIDAASQRFAWYLLEPNPGQYVWTSNPNNNIVSNFIDPLISNGKKVSVGIMWKGRYERPGFNSGCSVPNNSFCSDGTPSWALDPSNGFDPIHSTVDNHPMINYVNPRVQSSMSNLINEFVKYIESKYGNDDRIAFLVCTGMDCEAQPEGFDDARNPTDQAYIDRWGNGNNQAAVGVWINFVNWLVDTYDYAFNQNNFTNKVRYLVVSANFKDGAREKIAYANKILTKSYQWGIYSAAISTGYDGNRYSQPHRQDADELLTNNGDIQDLFRRFCLCRPCLGEHGDQGLYDDQKWKHWWRAASALWQRVDGFMTRGPWIPNTQEARQFFNTYAGKSFYDTPKAWVVLHSDYSTSNTSLRQRNFAFYLDQFDASNVGIDNKNAQSVPEWSVFVNQGQIGALQQPPDDYRGIFTRRTNNGVMAFRAIPDASGNYFIGGNSPHNVRVEITYLDYNNDYFSLYYYSASNNQTIELLPLIQKGNTRQWKTVTFSLNDALFNQSIPGGADFYIDDKGDGDEYIHMASVEYISGNPNVFTNSCPNVPTPTPGGPTVTPNLSSTPSASASATPGLGMGSIFSTITSPIGLLLVIALLIVLDFFVKPEKII